MLAGPESRRRTVVAKRKRWKAAHAVRVKPTLSVVGEKHKHLIIIRSWLINLEATVCTLCSQSLFSFVSGLYNCALSSLFDSLV